MCYYDFNSTWQYERNMPCRIVLFGSSPPHLRSSLPFWLLPLSGHRVRMSSVWAFRVPRIIPTKVGSRGSRHWDQSIRRRPPSPITTSWKTGLRKSLKRRRGGRQGDPKISTFRGRHNNSLFCGVSGYVAEKARFCCTVQEGGCRPESPVVSIYLWHLGREASSCFMWGLGQQVIRTKPARSAGFSN